MVTPLFAHQSNEALTPIMQTMGDPLLKSFGITHFGLIKVNTNHLMLRIANHEKWNHIYMEQEFYNDLDMYDMATVPINGRRKRILTGEPSSEHQRILYEQNLWHFLLIYERTETEGSFFFFGTTRDNSEVLNYYINYPNVFDHFIFHFKEKLSPFLTLRKDKCIQLKIDPLAGVKHDKNGLLESFYDKTKVSKFYLGETFNNTSLSKREAECLSQLVHGKTAKEIAKALKLSPRTVEYFLENIKTKTGIPNKSDLIQKLFAVALSLEQS